MGWARGKGSGPGVWACFPRLRSSGPAHTVKSPLGSIFPLSPKDWLWKLSSTLQDKLFVQTSGPGLGWGQGGESSYLPVSFPPPPSRLSQREGMPVGDRVGRHRVGTNSEAAVGGGRGRGRSTSWEVVLSWSGTKFTSPGTHTPGGPGRHTESLHSLPGCSEQPSLPLGTLRGSSGEGLQALQKAPPGLPPIPGASERASSRPTRGHQAAVPESLCPDSP